MPLDPSIPLAARGPDINPVNLLGQVMAIKGAQQQQQMRGLEITAEQQKIDANKTAVEDSRALTEAIRAHTGDDGTVDYKGVTKSLAGSGRGTTVMKWLDDVSKRDEQDYKTVQERLKATAQAGDLAARNFQGVKDQPSWDAAKVLTKTQLEGIHPGMGGIVDQLPPAFSEDAKQQAMTAGMGAKDLNEHLLKMAEDARKAPGEVADADKKARENAASRLGAAQSQTEYTKTWDSLPAGVAKMFPDPGTWNKDSTTAHVRQIGMAPNQQAASDYRTRVVGVEEGNLRARQRELTLRENQTEAKDPALTQDWREYVQADNANWRQHQGAVSDQQKSGSLDPPPKYVPLGTFADWRAKKYPDGVPPPPGRAKPSAAAPGPAKPAASTPKLPDAKQGGIHLTVADPKAPGGRRILEFDTIAARDKFLKIAGMTLKDQ